MGLLGKQSRLFANLLIVAVCQNPVFLLRMEKEAEDVKIQPILLERSSFVRTDEQTALHFGIR